jgi:3-hydroxybutyryl-CoA dehydrogenase
MVAAGRLGRKTARGYYDYAAGAAKPLPATPPEAPPPARVTVMGGAETGDAWAALIAAAGVGVDRVSAPGSELLLRLDHVDVLPTDGRLATERAAESGRPVVLFDLARDYRAARRLALAPADQAGPDIIAPAVGLIQACGKAVSIVDDSPGLVVMRSVAMIANGAADLVQRRIATAAAIDAAMRDGANYPAGPLAWAEAIGLPRILAVIDNLARFYGEDRYRAAPLLRRRVLAGAGSFSAIG